jgi:uncharacterized protein (TIRG00374 family)
MWFGLIVLLVFAVWAFTGYDFALVVSSLASADWRWICVGVGLNVLLLYLRVYKWRFFNSAFRDFSYFNMSLAAFAAYTCNMVVPAKVGAFVQAWLLSQKEPIPASTVLSTLVLVRVMDGVSLTFVGLLVFNFVEVSSEQSSIWDAYKTAGVLLASFLFFVIVFLFWLGRYPSARIVFERFVRFFLPTRFKASCGKVVNSLWEGFAVLNHGGSLGIIAFLSFVFWGVAATMVFVYLKAFYVIDVPMYLPLCIILAQAVGFMIPSPGYVGPFHAATVTALSFFDISGELALSIAIMMHAALFVTNSLLGIIYLWIENLNVVAVIKKAKDGFG